MPVQYSYHHYLPKERDAWRMPRLHQHGLALHPLRRRVSLPPFPQRHRRPASPNVFHQLVQQLLFLPSLPPLYWLLKAFVCNSQPRIGFFHLSRVLHPCGFGFKRFPFRCGLCAYGLRVLHTACRLLYKSVKSGFQFGQDLLGG